MLRPSALALTVAALLSGCDMLGIESPEKVAAAKEAEGRAVGAACRHAGRAIEDCYALNRRTDKAAIFAGWRDMNDYMRENKIEAVTPVVVAQAVAKPAADAKQAADAKPDAKGEKPEARPDAKAPDARPDAKADAEDKPAKGKAKDAKS